MNRIWIVMPVLIVLMFLLGIDLNKKAFADIADICLYYQKESQIGMAKKEGVRKMFDNIANNYDKLNHILSLNIDKRWRKKAVRELVDEPRPLKVLDVACGTGDFTIEIARKVAPESEITGVDISEGMIAVGMEKIAKSGLKASMHVADCEALPYADNTFDRISVGFGVRNFEHLELGLREMYRVLVPGGKMVILELSVPSNALIRWAYKLYFLKILPFIGGIISGNKSAYIYLPSSVLRFPAPEKFMDMMKSAGFDMVEHTSLTLGICRMYIGKKYGL